MKKILHKILILFFLFFSFLQADEPVAEIKTTKLHPILHTNELGNTILIWIETSNSYREVRLYARFYSRVANYDRQVTFHWFNQDNPADNKERISTYLANNASVFDYRYIAEDIQSYNDGKALRSGIWTIEVKDEQNILLMRVEYSVKIPEKKENKPQVTPQYFVREFKRSLKFFLSYLKV